MRNIIANIGWIFFDKIFRMAVGVLIGVWLARYLGPTEFGTLNYAILFPTIFASLAGFGLTNILMVEFVATNGDPLKQQKLLQIGFFIKIVVGLLTYSLSCCLNYILNRNNPELLTLINVTGTALILQSSDVIETYFQSQTKAKLSVVIKLIAFGLASTLRLYALLSNQSILFFIFTNVVELSIAYILMIVVYQRKVSIIFTNIYQSINYPFIRKLTFSAWPIMLTEFFVFVYMRVDQFMIKSLSTSYELGLYGAVLRLSEAWYFVSIAITTSFYPKIASFWDTDKDAFYNKYQQMLNLLIYISVVVSIVVSLCADPLIDFLYGQKFQGAGIILSVHIWTGLFVYIGIGTSNLFIINNLQQFVLGRTIIGALINICINYLLVPHYGALGSSIATLFAQFCSAYALNFFYSKSKPIFYLQSRALRNVIMLRKPTMDLIT